MIFILKSLLVAIEKILFPYRCIMCHESSDQRRDICRPCQTELPSLQYSCIQCGDRLLVPTVQRCGQCIKHPSHFDRAIMGFSYEVPIDNWLKQFKFHRNGLYARILTEIYAEKLAVIFNQTFEDRPDYLVPVPLHWRRRMQRGFNQAYVIASLLSKKLAIPILDSSYISRQKYTQPQSSLNQTARQSNIKHAFFIKKLPKTRHIAIVDDIFTTGSTVNELSRQLKQKGISKITILALARALS